MIDEAQTIYAILDLYPHKLLTNYKGENNLAVRKPDKNHWVIKFNIASNETN